MKLTLPPRKLKLSKITWPMFGAMALAIVTVAIPNMSFAQLATSPWPMSGHDTAQTSQSQFITIGGAFERL